MFFKEEDNQPTEFYVNFNYIAFDGAKPTKRYAFIHGNYGISFEILDNNDVAYDSSNCVDDYFYLLNFVYGNGLCKGDVFRIQNFHETNGYDLVKNTLKKIGLNELSKNYHYFYKAMEYLKKNYKDITQKRNSILGAMCLNLYNFHSFIEDMNDKWETSTLEQFLLKFKGNTTKCAMEVAKNVLNLNELNKICTFKLFDYTVQFRILQAGIVYYKKNDNDNDIKTEEIRNIIKLAKVINNTGLKLVKNNFYQFTENPNNSNYIVIDGININKNRIEFIDVYETPPVSNANA